ncbi:hypothetical protein GON26_20590 [Flavobacterium sp. GA093]|uniref:Uncharacterized protein n=1 Tax=Flavobacterium hydrocarbonoxydans TaxID=2683249 RepID=A0A6I4P0M1_9FLAO|nr:hypothetical protein [Flavobacterium hydrocarbonoxydans]MWB96767.1 hypothetical protein [Flavobacterium hydrocarbonoxydans]
MNKQKIAAIISALIALTGFIDTSFDLLQSVGLSLQTINQIKLSGLILAVVLPGLAPFFRTRGNT